MKKCLRNSLIGLLGLFLIGYLAYEKIPLVRVAVSKRHGAQEVLESIYFRILNCGSIYNFLQKSYNTFHIPKKGIIHIGARYAEELKCYEHFDIPNILWIEADPEAEQKLKKAVENNKGSTVALFAVSDQNGTATLHQTSNEGHSSSLLKLKEHSKYYPGITESKAIEVPAKRLDDYLSAEEKSKYNVIVIDIQGAELIALKGAIETLEHIDAIIAETNYDELYEGSVFVQDLDGFLARHGFTRTDSMSIKHYTGDALYIKNKFFKS